MRRSFKINLRIIDLQTIARLTTEKANAKEIARQEIEIEKRELEDKIASLYREITQNNVNRDQLMTQLYSRLNFDPSYTYRYLVHQIH